MQMYLNDVTTIPANLAGVPGISIPSGLAARGRPARRHPVPRSGARGRAPLPRRRARSRRCSSTQWGGPLLDRAPACSTQLGRGRCPLMAKDKLMDFDKALELFEPVLGFEVHVELNTKTKMFSARRTPQPDDHGAEPNTLVAPVDLGLPGLAAGRQRAGGAVLDQPRASRSAARSRRRAGSRARTTSTPTSARTTRSRSTTSRSRSRARSTSSSPTAPSSRCRSSARTWRRMPASSPTSAARPAASRVPSTRSSTTTAPACRSSRSSRSRSTAPSTARPRSPRRTCRRSATSCVSLGISEARWSAATCAATRTCRCARAGQENARHPHRDEERQLDALGRARGALRDPAPGRDPRRRRHDHAGDPALARGHRHDLAGPPEVATPTTTATSPSPTCCPSSRRSS